MSISLGDLVGNAAITGEGIIGNQIRSDQQLSQQKSLAQYNDDLARARMTMEAELKGKPLADFGKYAQAHANDETPIDQSQLAGSTDLSASNGPDGKPIQSTVAGDRGLVGNADKIRKQIMGDKSMSEEDRAGALAQIDAQQAQQPKSRKISNEGIVSAALKDSLADGNGAAYAVGLGLQNSDAKASNLQARLDQQREIAADKNATQQDRNAAWMAIKEMEYQLKLSKVTASSDKPDRVMSFIDGQRKEIAAEASELNRALTAELKANQFASPEEIKAIKDSYAPRLRAVESQRKQLAADFAAIRTRFGLGGLMGEEPAASTEPAAPAAVDKGKRPSLDTFKR